ncbi:MAG: hypothetical protein JW929_08270 [Anaerolineales bacterium]|nr:hypothetical protein [Anaerolineales bacterium]
MKRKNFWIILPSAALMLFAAACGSQSAEAGAAGSADRLNADYENALPVESQLILGTLKLEGTENAVTAEQAAELLPLWRMMKELQSRDTDATEEQGGLINQIQETMTAGQIRAIAAMQLTQDDMVEYMRQAGMGMMPQNSGTPAASGGGNALPGGMEGGGEPPEFAAGGGMPPGGGGGFQGGEGYGGGNGDAGLSAEQIATMQARRSSQGGAGGNPYILLDALLQMLDGRQSAA